MRASRLIVIGLTIVVALGASACRPSFDLADREDIFALPGDGGVMCAASMEWQHIDQAVIDAALDRAIDDRKILQLFGHDPGVTVPVDKVEMVFADAEARGLRFVTYRDLALGVNREAGLAFSFDDWSVDDWGAIRDLLRRHGARVTFFVARYQTLTDDQRAILRGLAADGHDIEFHSTTHQSAVDYARAQGVEAWAANELDQGLAAMRADGWSPIVFAYPAGHHTDTLDHAALKRFKLLRSVMRECQRSAHEITDDNDRDLRDEIGE